MIKIEHVYLKFQFPVFIDIDYHLTTPIKRYRRHVMHATPMKQPSQVLTSIRALRQILGWAILYTGALILVTQLINPVIQ